MGRNLHWSDLLGNRLEEGFRENESGIGMEVLKEEIKKSSTTKKIAKSYSQSSWTAGQE